MEYEFKSVVPTYTGGGIYCFYGRVNDVYFLACDDYSVRLVDVIPFDSVDEEMWYEEWQQEHLVKDLETESDIMDFFKQMLTWVLENRPDGNYLYDEMKDILKDVQGD